jgi:hypothetical protein
MSKSVLGRDGKWMPGKILKDKPCAPAQQKPFPKSFEQGAPEQIQVFSGLKQKEEEICSGAVFRRATNQKQKSGGRII